MKLQAANKAYTTLDGNYSAIATEITFIDASGFPSSGSGPFIVAVNDEIILIESRVGNVCTVATTAGTLAVDGRGYEGTAAQPHSNGDTVANKVTAAYINNIWDELSLNSTGGTVNGPVVINGLLTVTSSASTHLITGDVSVTGDVSITGSLTATGSLEDINIKNYTETSVSITPSTAKVLTLDLDSGNTFYATLSTAVDELVISNASTINTHSLTLELLLNADYSTEFYFTWQTPYAVASTGTVVSASSSAGTFSSTGLFATNVQVGDIVTVTGFSTGSTSVADASANNASWRIKSATASILTIGDNSTLIKTSTGADTVEITRRKEYFIDSEVPDAPEPYILKTFTGYLKDGDRWKIVEVGEF